MGHAAAIGHTTPWGEEADTEKRRQRGLLRAGAARADIRAAALTAHQARGLPQAGGHVAGWNRRRQCEVHLQDPVHLAFRAQYLANAESWKDLRAVHDSRGLSSERGPFLARSSRGAFPKGDLRGFSDTRRAYLAKASSFWMHGAHILPRTGDFPVRGPFEDAWSEKIATDCRPGMHRVDILPRQGARECAASTYRHDQAPGTHFASILPSPNCRERIAGTRCHDAGLWAAHRGHELPCLAAEN